MPLNPLLAEALASVVRSILKIGAGYLVARNVWTTDDATNYVGAAAVALVGLGWSYWTTYHSRLKLVTALAVSQPTTEAAVEKKIATGQPIASVTTPTTTVPILTRP
jgi:hypothetical protein